jgi:hypothetical protein
MIFRLMVGELRCPSLNHGKSTGERQMSAFELLTLFQMKVDSTLMNTSLWMGITFAVVVAGYATGKSMTRPMLWVLGAIYTLYTVMNRYGFYLMQRQAEGILRDIAEMKASGQYSLNSIAAVPTLDIGTIAFSASWIFLSVLVWGGAIYFLNQVRRD